MPNLQILLANCLIGTVKRDYTELSLGGLRVILRQNEAGSLFRLQDALDKTVHTTTLEFGDVSDGRRKGAEGFAADLAWLLSLATMSPVVILGSRFGATSWRQNVIRQAQYFRPTIEIRDGRAVRDYVHSTWAEFRRLKRCRRLRHAIDYLVISDRPGHQIEVRTLLAFTALESLKTTHSPGKKGEFQRRVEDMLSEVGMRRGLAQLVKLRNNLVHEGWAVIPYSRLSSQHERLQDILREYLLRLLGFRGRFYPYSMRGTETKEL